MRYLYLAPVSLGLLLAPAMTAASKPARPAAGREALPFIADDYPKALAEARARKLPLFIEAWAPW